MPQATVMMMSTGGGPRFVAQMPTQLTFLSDKGVEIECPVHGQPTPQITWLSSSSLGEVVYLLHTVQFIS